MTRQHATPIAIDSLSSPTRINRLERVRRSTKELGGHFVEDLLQQLVSAEPSMLPVEEIEPSFANLRSVCRELPLGKEGGLYLDNLLVNADGRICLVECKLWHNPEAIRSVVAQVLDYAGALASYTYEDLAAAVRKANRSPSNDSLLDAVLGPDADDDDKAALIDAISRSLKLGNFLLLIVGDGIRTGLQQIAGLLQNRATLGFSFALIEMAIYEHKSTSSYFIQPRLLVQTEIVTRTVFVTDDRGKSEVTDVSGESRPETLSEQDFYAGLASQDPSYPDAVRAFLENSRALGCEPELKRRLLIYVDDPTGGRINLGTISKDAIVEFWGQAVRDQELGQPVGANYMVEIAQFLPNAYLKNDLPNPGSWNIRYNDKVAIPLNVMLAKQDLWLNAIQKVISTFRTMSAIREN